MGKVRRERLHARRRPAPAIYDELYAEYVRLHDYFGRGGNEVMHRLRALRDRILGVGQDDDTEGDTTAGAFDNGTGDLMSLTSGALSTDELRGRAARGRV